MRKGYGRAELEGMFNKIGSALDKPQEVFLLGGGAMCFRDQKNATKDLDLVFEKEKDCRQFVLEIERIGFERKLVSEKAYEDMEASGFWQERNGFRLDLFVKRVCRALALSKGVRRRSELLGEYGKLTVRMFSNEDVVLFKGMTDRPDDANDMAAIIRSAKFDRKSWKTILEECGRQSGKEDWHCRLYDKLVEIKEKHGIDAPILKRLRRICEAHVLKMKHQCLRADGLTGEQAIKELRKLGFSEKEIGKAVD